MKSYLKLTKEELRAEIDALLTEYEKDITCGLKLTGTEAAFPFHKDPLDNNIRIAPSFPSIVDLRTSGEIFTLCQRIAAAEALLEKMSEEPA